MPPLPEAFAWQVAGIVAVGLIVGGWLDRLVRRLPLERSPLWPWRHHCPHCFAVVPRARSLPVIGPLFWRRCSVCHGWLDGRPLLLAILFTAGLLGLYWLHVLNGKSLLPDTTITRYVHSFTATHHWLLFGYHSALLAFLLVATFVDFDYMIIPDSITIPGMLVGLAGAALLLPMHPIPPIADFSMPPPTYFEAIVWDDFWKGRPTWLEQLRVALAPWWAQYWPIATPVLSSVVGLVTGGLLVWSIRAVSSLAFGRETLGLGDVTLMMLIGSFLGWQTVILAFFLSPISASLMGVVRWLATGRADLPYGPHLSLAAVAAVFCWRPLWWSAKDLFTQSSLFLAAAGVLMLATMLVVSIALRLVKGLLSLLLGRGRGR